MKVTWFSSYSNNYFLTYVKLFSILRRKVLVQLSCCDLCGQTCQNYQLLCAHCYNNLPKFDYHKTQGDLLNWPEINRNLPNIHFDHLISLAPHDVPFQSWLSQLKYQGRFELAQLLGELLATHYQILIQKFQIPLPDLITCVPIHIKRWQERGFNQTHLLSKQFIKNNSAVKQLPYYPNLIERNSNAMKQVGQTGSKRRDNLKNAFGLTKDIKLPEHILLLDDVVTTGATASEISLLLKQYGAKKITLITITLALAKYKRVMHSNV